MNLSKSIPAGSFDSNSSIVANQKSENILKKVSLPQYFDLQEIHFRVKINGKNYQTKSSLSLSCSPSSCENTFNKNLKKLKTYLSQGLPISLNHISSIKELEKGNYSFIERSLQDKINTFFNEFIGQKNFDIINTELRTKLEFL